MFDGHGTNGHECAWYSRERLPKEVRSNNRRLAPSHRQILHTILAFQVDRLLAEQGPNAPPVKALTTAHLITDQGLDTDRVDDSDSGDMPPFPSWVDAWI